MSCDLGNLYGAEYERPVGSGTAEPSMRIHFDGHSSLAEETFSERDFVKGALRSSIIGIIEIVNLLSACSRSPSPAI